MSLERETGIYKANLGALLGPGEVNEGQYVVIRGDQILGIYPDFDEALTAAYRAYEPDTFLVKRIERIGTTHFLLPRVVG